MNRKINSIIAIVVSIIIIGIMLFLSLSKEKTQADILNEQLRKQNASWIAKDYPTEIMEIPLIYDLPEDTIMDEKLFNINNINEFFPEETNFDLNLKSKEKNRNSGLIILNNAIISSPIYELDDKVNWKNHMTLGKNQMQCGACQTFAVLSAMEGYINKKYNYSGSERIHLSEQYLISYSNFMGCGGETARYYLDLITLDNYDSEKQTQNNYLKEKLKIEIKNSKTRDSNYKLKTKTQYSIAAGEVPFGVPLENNMKYLVYDSCEIIKLNASNRPTTGMDISTLTEVFKSSELNSKFCPDGSDSDNSNSPVKHKYTTLVKKDELTKYFISNYFQIDNKDCKKQNSTTVKNLKEALKYTPVIISIAFYDTMHNIGSGIWEKTSLDENTTPASHAVVLAGWGIDKVRNKEYWIIKNSFSDTWGDNGYFRVWIGDKDTGFECRNSFGFSGELITKPGKEMNDLLPITKQEIEAERQAEIQRINAEQLRQENLQRKIDNIQQPTTPIPNFPNDIDPLREYQILNINYQDTKYISDIKCTTIMGCMSNKLTGFYGNNQENEFS